MRWSKLKQQAESRFADGMAGRVELFTTRYRHAHDEMGRSSIALDGQELLKMSNLSKVDGVWEDSDTDPERPGGYDLPLAMREFLNLSIDDALESTDPLIRALAVLDRRTGERRLAQIDTSREPPFVRALVEARRETRRR